MNLPETSQALAEWIFQSQAPGPEIKWGHCWCCDSTLNRVADHLEAWVRLREAAARKEAIEEAAQLVELVTARSEGRDTTAEAIRALATARRELKPERVQPAGEVNEPQGGE